MVFDRNLVATAVLDLTRVCYEVSVIQQSGKNIYPPLQMLFTNKSLLLYHPFAVTVFLAEQAGSMFYFQSVTSCHEECYRNASIIKKLKAINQESTL